MKNNLILSLVFMMSIFAPQVGSCWGSQGHSIVGLLAQKILTNDASPEAKKTLEAVGSILGTTTFDQAAVWPDQVKDASRACASAPYIKDPNYKNPKSSAICDAYRATANWHFVNTDASNYVNDPTVKYYDDGDLYIILRTMSHLLSGTPDSVVKTISSFSTWQAQCMAKSDQPCKKEALEFLIHFVGDIHQPLHSGSNCDIGGNAQFITWFGQAALSPAPDYCKTEGPNCANYELHAAWDGNLLLHKTASTPIVYSSNEDYANQLLATLGVKGLTQSSDATGCVTVGPNTVFGIDDSSFPLNWINESLCYLPQVYTFPDAPIAKKGSRVDQRKLAQVDAKSVNRCQEDRKITTTVGGRTMVNYSAQPIGAKYYDTNVAMINERLYWAGNRLANLLKTIYGQGDKWVVPAAANGK